MVGSERLTQLRFGDDGHGNDIGAEFAEALRIAHEDLGATYVRAHAILHDDNHVVTPRRRRLARLRLHRGRRALRPDPRARPPADRRAVVHAGRDRARPRRDGVRVPRHHLAAARLVASGTRSSPRSPRHLVERYGLDEVAAWAFEVWNEPNLEVFWTGTQEEYLRLYDESARAVKDVDRESARRRPVDRGRRMGRGARRPRRGRRRCRSTSSPATPTATCRSTPGPRSTGTASPASRPGGPSGASARPHYGPIHDGVIGAPFVLSGFHDVQGRMEALVVLGDQRPLRGARPSTAAVPQRLRPAHRRQPAQAALLGGAPGRPPGRRRAAPASSRGDGADVLVRAWATRHDDGTVDVLVWNGTINGGR